MATITLLSKYEFDPQSDSLGEGGFAQVFRAYDTVLKKHVALKIFNKQEAEKFDIISEINKVDSLFHENLIRYRDAFLWETTDSFGQAKKLLVGVLEYTNMGDLSKFLKSNPTEINLKKILLDVLKGISYLHSKNIIHRDIKPANVLLSEENGELKAKISDFGTCKLLKDGNEAQSSKVVGTFEYMAPEQLYPKKFGIKGNQSVNLDLWAYGAIIYNYFTGHPPFGKRSSEITTEQYLELLGESDIIDNFEKISEPYRTICKLCLVKHAGQRVQSATELIKVLESEIALLPPIEEPPLNENEEKNEDVSDEEFEEEKKDANDETVIFNNDFVEKKIHEYRELFEAFYEDGKISDSERAQLSKKQTNLNLTQDVVEQIENEIKSKHNKTPIISQKLTDKKKSKKFILIAIITIVILGLGSWYFISDSLKKQKLRIYETALSYGNVKFDEKLFNEAIDYYYDAIDIMPKGTEAYEKLKQSNDSIEFYYNMCIAQGKAYTEINNYSEAKEAYNKALEWKPADATATDLLIQLDSLETKEKSKGRKGAHEREIFFDPRDGNVYITIKIGNQVWMAENLAYKPSSGNYWAYNNNQSNVSKYGYLYDWETAKKVCPSGWHLPSDAEWTQLTDYLGGDGVAGGKLKSTTGWNSPNTGASNSSGFTAVPGGYRGSDGTFGLIGSNGYWWSSTESLTSRA